jgi:lipopolysaccharide/colanic/teichoic acid biosynthesis glycosyltransferase
MAIRWLTRWIPWLAERSGEAALRGLPCAKKFRKTLAREQARAERLGDGFSLLALGVNDWRSGQPTLVHLARVVRQRLRMTDEPGWLDERRVGVILPGTPAWGAWTVADDLCRTFPADIPLPECKVYSYPSDWITSEEDRAGRLGIRRRTAVRRRPVASMEVFFLQRLPLWKRAMDIFGACVGLVLLAPLLAATSLLIKLTSRGPLFFRQVRDGLGGKRFVMYKFRTMRADAPAQKADLLAYSEQDGPAFKMKNDPRITWLGRYLRLTCIDELPQLWHVLRGEMSLVGPRPMDSEESQFCSSWQRRRLDVTPGLTCTWQVYGKSRVPFVEWMRMDRRYVQCRSFLKDLRLILATMLAVILHRASQ